MEIATMRWILGTLYVMGAFATLFMRLQITRRDVALGVILGYLLALVALWPVTAIRFLWRATRAGWRPWYLVALLSLGALGCSGDVMFVTGPMAGSCWDTPRAQIDTIGWVMMRDSSYAPALTCTTDPRIHVNP